MRQVGRLQPNFVDLDRVEWCRVICLKPYQLGAILCVTKLGDALPAKVKELDTDLGCGLCLGIGTIVDIPCPKCKGTGKRFYLPPQRPRNLPVFRGYFSLMPGPR